MKIKTIAIILTIITILFILTPNSNAVLNSNGSTPVKQTPNNWIINIRKIESLGGGLGLTETIKSDLTPSSASNSLDIHMEKNTEYGTMAILSASSYGNPNKIASGGTTTGNETGIVMNLNNEWTAAVSSYLNSNYSNMKNASSRYINVYPTTYVKKIGDAITETAGWHGSNTSVWTKYNNDGTFQACAAVLRSRSGSGSIFSYTFECFGETNGHSYPGTITIPYASRAAVVCGEGI